LECDYLAAVTWVRICIIIHSLTFEVEKVLKDNMYWEWIQNGQDDGEGVHKPVHDAFIAVDDALIVHESEGQRKRWQIQHTLFEWLHVV
jgi:predicted RNase H-like nuclease